MTAQSNSSMLLPTLTTVTMNGRSNGVCVEIHYVMEVHAATDLKAVLTVRGRQTGTYGQEAINSTLIECAEMPIPGGVTARAWLAAIALEHDEALQEWVSDAEVKACKSSIKEQLQALAEEQCLSMG